MISKRVILSYLKKLADLEHDFAKEVSRRWEKGTENVISEALHERQKAKFLKSIEEPHKKKFDKVRQDPEFWMNVAVNDPKDSGLRLVSEGKIKGTEKEFVDAVVEYLSDVPEKDREAYINLFVKADVPVGHLRQKFSEEQAFEILEKNERPDDMIDVLIDLLYTNRITVKVAENLALKVVDMYPSSVMRLNFNELLSSKEARKYMAPALRTVSILRVEGLVRSAYARLNYTKEELKRLIEKNAPAGIKQKALNVVDSFKDPWD